MTRLRTRPAKGVTTAETLPALGGVYFRAWVDDDHKVTVDQYILRTIRGRFAYLTEVNQWTWIKTGFGDRGTWGWAEKINPCWRERVYLPFGFPETFARSKSQAVRAQIRLHKRQAAEFPETDPTIIAEDARDLAALERRLKFEMRRKRA